MAKVTKVKVASAKDIELNQWCVEMAMKWPVITTHYGYGNAQGGLPNYGQNIQRSDSDADVIGRAAKILAWLKKAQP